jgi:hypothetical protein
MVYFSVFRKPVHMAASGFWKPFYDRTSSLKNISEYLRTYEVK